MKKTEERAKFEWGSFLQGGLLLYLLAIFLLLPPAVAMLHLPLPVWLSMGEQIEPSAIYFLIAGGIFVLLTATGLTFWGNPWAMLKYFRTPRREKLRRPMTTVTASGMRFVANERVKSMPKDFRVTLLTMIHNGEAYAAIQHYRQETKTDPRLAVYVIEQLTEFSERGLLDGLE